MNGILAFKTFDSTGKYVKTKHPLLASCLHNVKASLNLHIKMWKEGIRDGTFTGNEIREYAMSYGSPLWVIDIINKTVMDEWAKQTSI